MTFVADEAQLLDLDWILPVVHEFHANGWETRLLLLTPPVPGKHDLLLTLARAVADRIVIGFDSFEPLPSSWLAAMRRLAGLGRPWNLPVRAYFSHHRLRSALKGPLAWRRDAIFRGLREFIGKSELVFLSQKRDDRDGTPTGLVLQAARSVGASTVAYPPFVKIENSYATLAPYDLVLCNTEREAVDLRPRIACPAVVVGIPSLESSWLEQLRRAYESSAKLPDIPPGRQVVLILLKYSGAESWQGLGFAETTRNLLRQLDRPDRVLVLKPHPREDGRILREVTQAVSDGRCIVDQGPISYWAQRADIVVSQMSGAVWQTLAAGKVPYVYWPITPEYKRRLEAGHLDTLIRTKVITRGPDGSYQSYNHGFVREVLTPRIDLEPFDPEPYLQKFRAELSMSDNAHRVRQACEAMLAERSRRRQPVRSAAG